MKNLAATQMPKSPRTSVRQRILFALKLAISVSLLLFLFSLVDMRSVKASFAGIELKFVGFAVLLLFAQSGLSTFKWRTLLAADGVLLRFGFLLKTYLIGNFVSLFLPTSFGGDFYRIMAVRKASMSTAKTASSVLFDRLTGLFALLTIAAGSYVFLSSFPFKYFVIAGYVVGVFVFWLGSSGWILRRFQYVENSFARKILKIFESFNTYGKNSRCLLIALLISLVFQLNIVFINKMYALAIGVEVPIETLLVIIPLVYLTEAIPLSINGIGIRESAFVFFYQLIGQSAEAGLAVSLLVLAMRYGIGLVGGCLLVSSIFGDRPGRKVSEQ